MRVLFYVQHLLGTGHLRRIADLAAFFEGAGETTCIASGGDSGTAGLQHCGEIVQLPSLKSADATFSDLITNSGERPDEDYWGERGRMIHDLVHRFRPDLLVIETYPFGRRKFAREISRLLDEARRVNRSLTVVCSIRDILQPKDKPSRIDEIVGEVNARFDQVWVHGDDRLVSLEATFPGAGRLEVPVYHTGYIATGTGPGDRARSGDRNRGGGIATGEVLVSAGGGAVGKHLYLTAIRSAWLTQGQRYFWRIRVGGNLEAGQFEYLEELAPSNVVVERASADFRDRMERCFASVSQAGYNTCVDALASGCASILVPFAEHGEREQLIRSRLMEDIGMATVIEAGAVDPPGLLEALAMVGDRRLPRQRQPVNLSGAQVSLDLARRATGQPRRMSL